MKKIFFSRVGEWGKPIDYPIQLLQLQISEQDERGKK